MASHESVKKTIVVAFLLCIVFSIVVSVAAVVLSKPQAVNKELDRQKNILIAADLYKPGVDIQAEFKKIETRAVNLKTDKEVEGFKLKGYDERKAAKDTKSNIKLPAEDDSAGIKRVAEVYVIYLVKSDDGKVQQVVLPIFGKGLWSTMYGFISVDRDLKTVRGITFYEHGETPGLGGEIDNPRWQGLWKGKAIYNSEGEMALQVIKGEVQKDMPGSQHKIDGLAGATITARGVSGTINFWLGKNGYGEYLSRLRAELEVEPLASAKTQGDN